MTGVFDGGCACGAVRYRLTSAPMFVNCCHCRECQRHTGSAFVLNGVIETDRIVVTAGSPRPVALPTGSGQPHDVHRCPECKVAVWSDYGRRPALRFVRIATLDDPAAFAPGAHIFTASKLPWVVPPPGQPVFEAYYDLSSVWPAESLARRRAATG